MRYIVFLFTADRFSGTLVSSSEGRVFWVEQDEVLKLPWIWEMDKLMQIFAEGEFAELFMRADEDWVPHMK